MSVGFLLVSIELFFMIIILAYIPKELAGPCFIGFAIGESLGASALRICGGIFTKIADIGSDLMKIVFHLPEDDPKNPGVIADCTGDNAGDSVGPTADGFETYGVTGVALIAFLALALAGNPAMGGKLIVWIFAMRILMILTSLVSYFVNDVISKAAFAGKKEFNFEHPLTNLVWITSLVSIAVTFAASYYLLGDLTDQIHRFVVASFHHHQLRNHRRCFDSGIYKSIYQHQFPSLRRSCQRFPSGRRFFEHSCPVWLPVTSLLSGKA
jgi:K(+)-stimulated pyrophosphate-energized sodium pump